MFGAEATGLSLNNDDDARMIPSLCDMKAILYEIFKHLKISKYLSVTDAIYGCYVCFFFCNSWLK